MTIRDKAKELVKARVRKDMPDEIKTLVDYARADLNFGPAHAYPTLEEDPGFSFEGATTKIATWLRDNAPSEVWVDMDCEMVGDREPEGYYDGDDWIEPCTEDTHYFDRADILRAAFGELAEYLR
jgi:hypothetical protein